MQSKRLHFGQFRIKKVQTQMILCMMIVIVAISFGGVYLTVKQSEEKIQENYAAINQSNLQVYSEMFDLRLTRTVESLRKMVYDTEFINLLSTPDSDNSAQNAFLRASVRNRMNALMGQETVFTSIAIFDSYERYIYSTYYSTPEIVSAYTRYQETHLIKEMDWYQAAEKAIGKEVFWGNNVFFSGVGGISFSKLLRDPLTQKFLGVVVATIDISIWDDTAFIRKQNYDSYVLMVLDEDREDQVVFTKGGKLSEDSMFSTYLEERDGVTPQENSPYTFTSCTNKKTGWTFITGVEKREVSSTNEYLLPTTVYILTLIIAGLIILSIFTSIYINRPLKKLKESINKFSTDHQLITAEFDDGEIGEISTFLKGAVNDNIELNKRILALNNREREMEFQALQAQINPHFLYNTLDSLYFMAVINHVEEIAEMTAALSDIFKITLNKGKSYVKIQEELDYIQKYILIQNMRFSNKISLQIHIDEKIDIQKFCMLKFLIQPFIENAVYHGFEPKIGKGIIKVTLCRQGMDAKISIEDNGVGMESLDVINRGYGVNNIAERIRLFYGDQYGLEIKSVLGQGTQVHFSIPLFTEEKFLSEDTIEI